MCEENNKQAHWRETKKLAIASRTHQLQPETTMTKTRKCQHQHTAHPINTGMYSKICTQTGNWNARVSRSLFYVFSLSLGSS